MSSSHIQSVIQSIMRNFQATSTQSSALPVHGNPTPLNSLPANNSTNAASTLKPKIAATFLHFYSDPNRQINSSSNSGPDTSWSSTNSSTYKMSEPIKCEDATEEFAPKPSIVLNVSTPFTHNPFKRPLNFSTNSQSTLKTYDSVNSSISCNTE